VFPWFRRNHMNSADELAAFRHLGAESMLPIHYETYPASFQPTGAARQDLIDASIRGGVRDRVKILDEGSSLEVGPIP
jgi:L-ascorbate metabolism protein UlaG (beta-lactamase superfamily)